MCDLFRNIFVQRRARLVQVHPGVGRGGVLVPETTFPPTILLCYSCDPGVHTLGLKGGKWVTIVEERHAGWRVYTREEPSR